MNEHDRSREAVPFYAAGTLDPDRRRLVERHLEGCPECRRDLALWKEIHAAVRGSATEEPAPQAPLEKAMARIRRQPGRTESSRLRPAADLVRWQAALLRREFWPVVALLTAVACAAALLTRLPAVLRISLPLIAATSLAVVTDPGNDPSFELIRSSPTPPGRILLARATLVFGYNLALAAGAGLLLGTALPREVFRVLIVDGLGAMTFLSALALVLSISWGTGNAVAAAYALWFLRFLPAAPIRWLAETLDAPPLRSFFAGYRLFWQRPLLLLPLAALLVLVACRQAGRWSRGGKAAAAGV